MSFARYRARRFSRVRFLEKLIENHRGQQNAENAGNHEVPRSLERNRAEHSDSVTREKKIDRALNGQAPADESDDERDALPDIVERDDERAERKVNESVQ